MNHLTHETAKIKEYWKIFTLEKARFLFSCRTGCNTLFTANDWNTSTRRNCYCGPTRKTAKHLLLECPLYNVCRNNNQNRLNDYDEAVNFWFEILEQKASLAAVRTVPSHAAPSSDTSFSSQLSSPMSSPTG